MKQVFRSTLGIFLAVMIVFSGPAVTACAGTAGLQSSASEIKKPDVSAEDMSDNVCKVLVRTVPSPTLGTYGGEWTVLALARSDYSVSKSYFTTYYNNVVREVKSAQGKLSSSRDTEYSRVILGLTSIGRDPRNVGGYNLISSLADFDSVKKQGINGPIFALLALDSHNYDMPEVADGGTQNSRSNMVHYILSQEIKGGGWALRDTNGDPDPDITAMALQALAKYKNESGVSNAISRGLEVLSKLQKSDGDYSNAECTAQVIVALAELGINPETDSRFIKPDGSWLLSALEKYYVAGKGFKHTSSGSVDAMATDQCAYALAAFNRGSLYDMSGISLIELKITNFAELTSSVKYQKVKHATSQDSLTLPTSLTATVNGKKETIIGITWESEPDYDSETAGTYTFTAELPDGNYILADNTELPQIQVTVTAQSSYAGGSSSGGSSRRSSGSPGTGTAAVEKTDVSLEPDEAPVVTGDQAAITATVQADVASIISGATAEKQEKIKIISPAASIVEQLKKDIIKTAVLTIKAPKAVTNNTSPNAKVEIDLDKSVLQTTKDMQKSIVISVVNSDTGKEMYSWTFSGASFKNSVIPVTTMNLVLNVAQIKSNTVVSSVVSANSADKSNSGALLQFANSGLLPGAAKVKIDVGNQDCCTAGSKVFLYYVNDNINALEKLPRNEYTVDAEGYVTLALSHCSDYVLLPKAAASPYPVESDTVYPTGIKIGETYTFGITVSGSIVPALTVGNAKAFGSTVKRAGNKYYLSVKAVGTPGTMTAVYSALPGQKPVVIAYITVEK